MTSQQFLVCDSSTLANFKSWAQAISGFFSTAGWSQSSDTGQVNWSTIASVPGSGAFVYEVWQPNDALTNFYLKVEYGNASGSTNNPSIRLSLSTTTNGAGTLTGTILGPFATVHDSTFTIPSSSITYECDFSGAAGRMQVMMWRNAGSGNTGVAQVFSVERSINSGGSYTSSHVTITTLGPATNNGTWQPVSQQTLVFGIGVAPAQSITGSAVSRGGLSCRTIQPGNSASSSAFNGCILFDSHSPFVGYYDYALTGLGISQQADLSEGVPFSVTLYGSTRTYMPTKNSYSATFAGPNVSPVALCVRYD